MSIKDRPRYCPACRMTGPARLCRWEVWTNDIHSDRFAWQCRRCGGKARRSDNRNQWIGRDKLEARGIVTGNLPFAGVLEEGRVEGKCEHCGATERLENHHWAPVSMFSDANKWPQSLLCSACHKQWHQRVTPYLVKR